MSHEENERKKKSYETEQKLFVDFGTKERERERNRVL
jgi:hypothetical protein